MNSQYRLEEITEPGVVSRMYGQPVTASTRDGQPAGFTWREQDYTVLGVREHWVISSQWWQRGGPDAGVPPDREYWRVEHHRDPVPRSWSASWRTTPVRVPGCWCGSGSR
jgi:hypothetical protein